MSKISRIKWISLSLCFLSRLALGQGEIKFTSLSTKDGLSSNKVFAMIKDRHGLIWIGTTDGLNKYDGTNFTVYRHNPLDNNSLPANEVTALFEDHLGRIWIGINSGGICYYDPILNLIVKCKADGKLSDINNMGIRAICEDHNGIIWLGGYGQLVTFNPQNNVFTRILTSSTGVGVPNMLVVLSLFVDSRNRMWVGTNDGLNLFNSNAKKVKQFVHVPKDKGSLSNNVVKAIVEDDHHDIWVATVDGLDKLNTDGYSFQVFNSDAHKPETLSNSVLQSMVKGSGDKLWIGTEDGLNIFDTKSLKASRILPDRRDSYRLGDKIIRSILVDNEGIYWLGTFQWGVYKYNPHLVLFNLKQGDFSGIHGLAAPAVTSFAEKNNGQIYLGTEGRGIQIFDHKNGTFSSLKIAGDLGNSKQDLSVKSLEFDKQGNLWAGTISDGLFKIDPVTGKYTQFLFNGSFNGANDNDIYCLKQDHKGYIWAGTNGDGVNIYDPIKGTFFSFSRVPKKAGDLFLPLNGYMRTIAEAKNGDIWLGSLGTGIAVFHPGNKTFSVLNKFNSGLSTDAILNIFHDRSGRTWVGTLGGGINVYDEKTHMFQSYAEKDGLASDIVGKILQDDSGKLWLSTAKGISSFDVVTKEFKNFTAQNGVQNGSLLEGSGLRSTNGELYFGGNNGLNYFDPSRLPIYKNVSNVVFTDIKIANLSVFGTPKSPVLEQIGVQKQIDLSYGQDFSISYIALNYTNPERDKYVYKLVGYDKGWNNVGTSKIASYTNIDPGDYDFQVTTANDEDNRAAKITSIHIKIRPPFWRTIYAYFFYVCAVFAALIYIRHRGIKKIKMRFQEEQKRQSIAQNIENERRESERTHELDLQKIKFLTNLSHEFRTPISLIMAPSDKLLAIQPDDETAGQVKIIRRNARRLLNMVNQLLDFRKMEEHELKLNTATGDLIFFIKDAAESFKDISDLKKIHFSVVARPENFPARFDHDKIERIVFNLLSNAFKFTPEGGKIELNLSVIQEQDDCNSPLLCLKVTDSGIGIPLNEQARIFDRFFQYETDASILNQGSGIGLSITKEHVELQGGTIEIESTPEYGSVFIVKLPIDKNIQTIAEDLKRPSGNQHDTKYGQENSQRLPILLVEDNEEFRAYLSESLEPYYQIIEAADGLDGWQKTLSRHPQLIVSDVSMPNMNGVELCKKIKSDKRTSFIPVILLTALNGEEAEIRGLKSGANDYLTKPFNFQILNEKVGNLLTLNQAAKKTYLKQIKYERQAEEVESMDEKLMKQIIGFIEERIIEADLSVEELSKYVGMSRSTLYHKILDLTGVSPVEYIRDIKLEKAALLLEKSGHNVAQVSYLTGFATPSYFSRKFRAKYNMLPSDYVNLKRSESKDDLS